jgi:hypothetical protein
MKNLKISRSIKAKAKARKIIMLRTRAILRRFIEKEFPYVEIRDIKLDYFHLPEELNKQYSQVLKEAREE